MILAGAMLVGLTATASSTPPPTCVSKTVFVKAVSGHAPPEPCFSNELKLATVDTQSHPELRLVVPAPPTFPASLQAAPSPLRVALAPSPSPTPPCTRKATVKSAVQPDYPDAARGKVKGTVYVTISVSLDAAGKITGATIIHSSGNEDIDTAALRAAHESTYLPEIENCKAVPGTFVSRADFSEVF